MTLTASADACCLDQHIDIKVAMQGVTLSPIKPFEVGGNGCGQRGDRIIEQSQSNRAPTLSPV
jgi:hypothetical protein